MSSILCGRLKLQKFLVALFPELLLLAMIVTPLTISGGCTSLKYTQADMTEHIDKSTNSPVYFGGWGSYQIPFVPQEPISKDEAEKRQSYYVGYYNNERQLERFEKFLDGKLNWKDEYVYWDNGKLQTRKMLKADGTQTIQHFDRNGNLIR